MNGGLRRIRRRGTIVDMGMPVEGRHRKQGVIKKSAKSLHGELDIQGATRLCNNQTTEEHSLQRLKRGYDKSIL